MGRVQRKRQKRKQLVYSVLGMVFLVSLLFYFVTHFNKDSEKQTKNHSSSSFTASTSLDENQETTESKQEEIQPLELSLTATQVTEWVQVVLTAMGAENLEKIPGVPRYIIHEPTVDPFDQFVYVRIQRPQTNDLGQFRINAQGELEFSEESGVAMAWEVVSPKFLDTGFVQVRYKETPISEAYQVMESLVGTWGVPRSDNIITIHEDGSWTTHVFGSNSDRQIPVKVNSYEKESNHLNLTIDGRETKVYIISETELMMVSENKLSSTFVLISE